jgi:hypothetical protein
MKKNIIYIAAMAMLTAACSNEDDTFLSGFENKGTGNMKMITETITATSGDGATRAAIDANAKFTWSAGDQIAVHVSDGKYYTTEALTTGGNNTADFTVAVPEGELRDAFAVYPASIVAESAANYGQSGKALDVTLPGSYAIDEVSGTTTPCPMIADNTGSSWTFKQLCGMLRLVVKNIPTSATYLKIDFDGKKVQGAFSIASTVTAGTSTIATSATTSDDDIITITGLTGASRNYNINLPLPTGNYTNVTVTAYNSNDLLLLTITRPLKTSGTYTAARAKGHKVAAVLPAFSVSANKKIAFSPGNLQYKDNATTYKWRFAPHQYDCITSWNTSKWVDHFNWGTWTGNNPNPILVTSNESQCTWGSGDFKKESLLEDESQRSYDWYTLSSGEWTYLFDTRASGSTVNGIENARYTMASINTDGTSVNGLIVFPDGVAIAASEATTWGAINETSDWATKCTSAQWTALAAKGCTFLPATGERWGVSTTISKVNQKINYWSSTIDGAYQAFCVYYYGSGDFISSLSNNRTYGYSVRLVRSV